MSVCCYACNQDMRLTNAYPTGRLTNHSAGSRYLAVPAYMLSSI